MNTLLATFNTKYEWLNNILEAVTNFVNPILIVVAVAGIIYAIWVGIKFVKADEKNEREEAKSKLIMVIVGIVVTVLLIALFYFLAYNLDNIVTDLRFDTGKTTSSSSSSTSGVVGPVQNVVTMARMLLAR